MRTRVCAHVCIYNFIYIHTLIYLYITVDEYIYLMNIYFIDEYVYRYIYLTVDEGSKLVRQWSTYSTEFKETLSGANPALKLPVDSEPP